MAERVHGLSTKMDDFDATQKKILDQLRKLELSSGGDTGSPSFMSGNNVNGQPKHPSTSPGVSSDGAGVGIPLLSSEGFFRSPDPTKLFANTQESVGVALSEFHKSFVALAAEADLGDQTFKVSGEELDDHLEIQFLGDQRTATLAARQFFFSIQLGKGVWKKQGVLGPMESQIKY